LNFLVVQLSEERPTQFLLTLRTKLAKGDVSDMIREIFIAKMPNHLRNSLIAMKSTSLDKLAIAADKMVCSSMFTAQQSLYALNRNFEQSGSSAVQKNNVSPLTEELESKLDDILKYVKTSKNFESSNRSCSNRGNLDQNFSPLTKISSVGNKWQTN